MDRRLNILLGLNHTVAFDRRAFMGIATASNELGNVRLMEHLSSVPWSDVIETSQIDGLIIGRAVWRERLELNRLGIPFVSLADALNPQSNEYIVSMEEEEIGAIAAHHFLDSGYQNFAACVRAGVYRGFSVRIGGFVHAAEGEGRRCVIGPQALEDYQENDDFKDETSWAAEATEWIRGLPKPLAVFAPYDYHARVVVNAAQAAGLKVPDDVAVIGVDDDEIYRMTTSPQMSSVVTPGRQVGEVALKTLLTVLSGGGPVERRTLIKPPSIMLRGSSSDFAVMTRTSFGRCGSSGKTPAAESASKRWPSTSTSVDGRSNAGSWPCSLTRSPMKFAGPRSIVQSGS